MRNATLLLQREKASFAKEEAISNAKVELAQSQTAVAEELAQDFKNKLAAMSETVQETREAAEQERKSAEAARTSAFLKEERALQHATAWVQEEKAKFVKNETMSKAKVELAESKTAVAEALVQDFKKRLAAMSETVQTTKQAAEDERKAAEAARASYFLKAEEAVRKATSWLQEERAKFVRNETISEAKVEVAQSHAAVAEALIKQFEEAAEQEKILLRQLEQPPF